VERYSSSAFVKSLAFNVKGSSSSLVALELARTKSLQSKLKSAFVFK
jgi:hypothetical protein